MPRKPRLPKPPMDAALADAWQLALGSASRFKELEPWCHFAPDALLGVRDPRSNEVDWCAVMGHGGEVFGVAIYPGDAGFATWDRMARGAVDEFDTVVAQRAFTLTFESAATLVPASKRLLQRLGRTFRGARAWPELLVHEPGLLPLPPWQVSQLLRIANALEGITAALPWAKDDPAGGVCPVPGMAWVCSPPFGDADRRQQDLPAVRAEPVEPPAFDQLAVARLREQVALGAQKWFLDWFSGPSVVDGPETEGRPYFTSHLIAVDPASDMLLGAEIGRIETVAADLQSLVLQLVERFGTRAPLLVRREDLAAALRPFAKALGVPLVLDTGLISITAEVRADFMAFLGR